MAVIGAIVPGVRRVGLTLALLVAAPVLSGGCISVDVGGGGAETPDPDRFHVVELDPAPRAAGAAPAAGLIVAVRSFRASDRIDKRVLVRATPGLVTPLARDFWADEPSRSVSVIARDTIGAHAGYAAAVDVATAARADQWVDGEVLKYALETPVEGPWRAVCRVRLTWIAVKSGDLIGTHVGEASADLPGRATEGLGAAMARAVRDAVAATLR